MKKIIFFLVFILGIFFTQAVYAQDGADMRCWAKDKCESKEVGGKFYSPNDETRRACGSDQDAKKQPIGFCLPPYSATTQIDFGGTRTFDNLGVFIKYLYRYAIIIAGILSVVMIIVAGFQWATSGGNSERVSSAKKRISGALMGLFLAVLSYAVLANLNPYLVNLRLPQAWLINEQKLTPVYCEELGNDEKVILARKQGEKLDDKDKKNKGMNGDYEKDGVKALEAKCGDEYFVKNSGGLACTGTKCGVLNQVCMKDAEGKKYVCENGNIGGFVIPETRWISFGVLDCFSKGKMFEGWQTPSTDIGETELWAFCEDGDSTDVGQIAIKEKLPGEMQRYSIKADLSKINEVEASCLEKGKKFKGMALMFEMAEYCDSSDEEHIIGKVGNWGIDLGDEGQVNGSNSSQNKKQMPNIGLINKLYFIQKEQLEHGVMLNLDARAVHDIDDVPEDRAVYKSLY